MKPKTFLSRWKTIPDSIHVHVGASDASGFKTASHRLDRRTLKKRLRQELEEEQKNQKFLLSQLDEKPKNKKPLPYLWSNLFY